MKKSFVSPSFLKQIARKLKREKSFSHSQALDEAAKLYGYSNYKNYLNSSKDSREQTEFEKESLLKDIFSEMDISKKVPLAISFLQKYKPTFQDSLNVLRQFENSEEALQLVGNCLNLEDDIQKFLLNDFIESNEIQNLPLKEHFVAKKVSVKELVYQISDNNLAIDGNYELELEFEFEVPEELKNEPHFNREPMFGDFELTIDKNKMMSIKEQSIGENI